MRGAPAAGARAGFTLIELLIASMIFAMVIAGLAAIYSSVFAQSGRVLTSARYQTMANASMRAMAQQVSTASRMDQPAKGSAGDVLVGCENVAPDGTAVNSLPGEAGLPAPETFAYCVGTNVTSDCPTAEPTGSPQGCLMFYRWDNACVSASTNLSAANCNSPGMVIPNPSFYAQMATNVEYNPNMSGGYFFSRVVSDSGGDNGVRAAFEVKRQAFATQRPYVYAVDQVLDGQFDGEVP